MTTEKFPAGGTRVVVGVDGSEPSKHALRWAQFLAHACGGTVDAVAAWQPFTTYGWYGAGASVMPTGWNPAQDAEKALASTVDHVFGDRPDGMRLIVREGNPAKILLEASVGARMLVVGNRGHGGFVDLLLGSVSAACTEHASCPVLVLHGDAPPPG